MDLTGLDFVTKRFDELDSREAQALLPLTLSSSRGDTRDGETQDPGSSFRLLLHDAIRGYKGTLDRWATIAYDGRVPVAWCLMERLCDDPITDGRSTVPEGAVGFYVSPRWRRRSLASRLLSCALETARAQAWHRLVAYPWNRSSSSFFMSHGFVEKVPYGTPVTGGVALLDLRGDGGRHG